MKIYIETYGCSANVNDSEIMAGLLAKQGHQLTDDEQSADAVIINTCTVKGKTENTIKRRLQEISPHKKLIVAGCMAEAQTSLIQELVPEASIIGPHRVTEINKIASGEVNKAIGKSDSVKVGVPKISKNPAINIIQINEGCMGGCTFCITKFARGTTYSYPMGSIRNEVEKAVKDGCKEFWFTSQDTGTYGLDRRSNLPELLKSVCTINGTFFVRVGMMNPTLAKHLLQPMIYAYKNPKIFKFLHIPVQAGNNRILHGMKRGYKVEDFKDIVEQFRKHIPNITISTDIICGFPTETDSEFNDTLRLIDEVKPDVLNISRFTPRPGTAAAKMVQLNGNVTKIRSTKLTRLFKKTAQDNNDKWVGWIGKILVDEMGQIEGTMIGRNFAYKPVVIQGNQSLLGEFVKVKIVSATSMSLKASLID